MTLSRKRDKNPIFFAKKENSNVLSKGQCAHFFFIIKLNYMNNISAFLRDELVH